MCSETSEMEGSNSQTWIMASSALLYLLISNVIALNAPNSISDTGTIQLVQVTEPESSDLCSFGCCDCLEESEDGGCTTSPWCTEAVTVIDPLCETWWDHICVAIAEFYCENDSYTDPLKCCGCLDAIDAPGCSTNAACQLQVCLQDEYCCIGKWDAECLELAQDYCLDPGFNSTTSITSTSTISTTTSRQLPPITSTSTTAPKNYSSSIYSTCYPTLGPTYEPTKEPTDPTGYPTGAPTTSASTTSTTTSTSINDTITTAAPSSNPTAVRNGNQPVSNTPKTESDSFISFDNTSQNVILFGVLAVASCCLLTFCCVIIFIYKKLSNKSAFDLQQIQIAKDDRIIMSNALIANIVIGKYDDDANAESPYLKVDSVIDDMKQFASDFGYQYMSMNDKRYWTEQEILSFLRDDVGAEFFDENAIPKYDGLIVGITSHGNERNIVSSDGEVMDKVAIHRVISNQYAVIRDFPRIFVFDLCDVPESLKISTSMSAEHTILDTVSADDIAQNAVHITNESDTHIVEMKEDEAPSMVDIGKNTDFEDVRQINEWTHNTKNPDYNLVTIDSVGNLSTSNVIHCFAERVRLNVENQEGLGLTDVMDHIRTDLRQRQDVSFVPVLNNKTPTMMIGKKKEK